MNNVPSILRMPPGFLWGVATAAHQNEGDNHNNQWAAWEQQPGRIHQGQRSGKATDWWNLETAAADFDRTAELGLNSVRLSVEWSRIEPEPGVFDASALRQYAEMLRLLRQRGLEPMVTLHHFTDPLWLAEIGGWENPLVEDYFSRFTARVVETLGDQVTLWCTINEPLVYAVVGYLDGRFPPGVKNVRRAMNVLRRMLLAHGRAYRTIHRLQNNARAGLAHHMRVHLPANPASAADRRAAAMMNQVANRSTLAAITEGKLTPLIGLGQMETQLIVGLWTTRIRLGHNRGVARTLNTEPTPRFRAIPALWRPSAPVRSAVWAASGRHVDGPGHYLGVWAAGPVCQTAE